MVSVFVLLVDVPCVTAVEPCSPAGEHEPGGHGIKDNIVVDTRPR